MGRRVKQKQQSDCLAAVASMIVDRPIEDFYNYASPEKPPYSDLTFYRYLLLHGYLAGHVVQNPKVYGGLINFSITLDNPAVFHVRLESGELHSIYWDGEMVYDPRPMVSDGLPLDTYKLEWWIPVKKMGEIGSER